MCIDMELRRLCLCLGFDMDVYSSRLPSSQLPSGLSAHTPWFLLPRLWRYSLAIRNNATSLLPVYVFSLVYVFVSECVLEGDKTHVLSGQRWTDQENECITCICNVRELKLNYCWRNTDTIWSTKLIFDGFTLFVSFIRKLLLWCQFKFISVALFTVGLQIVSKQLFKCMFSK